MIARIDEIAQRALGDTAMVAPVPDQAPEEVLELLRDLGAAMSRAQDNAERITLILDDVAKAYGAYGVSFFVLPTGIFVRIEAGSSTRVDFAPTSSQSSLRLDQIDQLYRVVDDIRQGKLDVATAKARLAELLRRPRRLGMASVVIGTTILTLGLGLLLHPTAGAVPAYLLLGLVVGVLQWVAERERTLAMLLPVAASFAVTWAAFAWAAPTFDAAPLDLVIAALVVFLPGAALTMATVELAAGSMLSGSARLVYGLQRLLLLSFGIAMGVQVAGLPDHAATSETLGAWAPWVGVFVFAVGHFFASAAPGRTFAWLVLVLYVAYAAQFAAGAVLGSLGGSFVAGAVLLPVAYLVQDRRSGPPVPATFLPAFWMLVPGALGLEGVTQLIGDEEVAGLGDFLNALLAVVAIAIGVLVGSGFSERVGRATSHWRGI
ncbi:threonine/serine exporter family protein [Nocardioides caricicola]